MPKFKFYEIVRVKNTTFSKKNGIHNLEGTILGMVEGENHNWFYAVQLHKDDEGWDLPENLLEPTGKMDKRENYYDESVIKVKVNPDTGDGEIIK